MSGGARPPDAAEDAGAALAPTPALEAALTPALAAALAALRDDRVVAVPTESSFGLLARIRSPRALDRLLALKPRSAGKGQVVLLPHRAAWDGLVTGVPATAARLAAVLWPGPLTVALVAAPGMDARLLEDGRLAVRLPGRCDAARLAAALGEPVTATSANPPGAPPALESEGLPALFPPEAAAWLHVVEGRAPGGAPSTVVVIDGDGGVRVVREGAVAAAAVQAALLRT